VRFELGSVMAQQGDLVRAIAYYHEAMAVADGGAPTNTSADPWRILARNNMAYHLHLLGDLASAERHIADAMTLAEERGAIALQPYLFSTAGEITLARGDLDEAERLFSAGMALAERLHIPERIAGLGANLGLVALRREEEPLAIHRLSTALARADALGTRHLAAQIRVWLAPLLPPAEARAALSEARAIAESGGRKRILEQIERLEHS
jgi:tetratricopeptide (TPR) repeat protein